MDSGGFSPFTVILFLVATSLAVLFELRTTRNVEELREEAQRTGDLRPVRVYKRKVGLIWFFFIVPVAVFFIAM